MITRSDYIFIIHPSLPPCKLFVYIMNGKAPDVGPRAKITYRKVSSRCQGRLLKWRLEEGFGCSGLSTLTPGNRSAFWAVSFLGYATPPPSVVFVNAPVPSRSTPEGWSWESMQTLGRTHALDTPAVWVTMTPMLRPLLTGGWTYSSLTAAIWTGLC